MNSPLALLKGINCVKDPRVPIKTVSFYEGLRPRAILREYVRGGVGQAEVLRAADYANVPNWVTSGVREGCYGRASVAAWLKGWGKDSEGHRSAMWLEDSGELCMAKLPNRERTAKKLRFEYWVRSAKAKNKTCGRGQWIGVNGKAGFTHRTCKQRNCLRCQRAARTAAIRRYEDMLNATPSDGYQWAMVTLTAPATVDTRAKYKKWREGLRYLIDRMRRGAKGIAPYTWAGGLYVVEVVPRADGTANVHAHMVVASRRFEYGTWRGDSGLRALAGRALGAKALDVQWISGPEVSALTPDMDRVKTYISKVQNYLAKVEKSKGDKVPYKGKDGVVMVDARDWVGYLTARTRCVQPFGDLMGRVVRWRRCRMAISGVEYEHDCARDWVHEPMMTPVEVVQWQWARRVVIVEYGGWPPWLCGPPEVASA